MTARLIVPIVEGQGEQAAVPILIRRIFSELQPTVIPEINFPVRVKAASFLNEPGYFKRYVELAAAKAAQGGGRVLILLDCEDSCPGILGPHLLERARAVRSDIPILVALAHREFETWFLAAAASLAGREGLPAGLEPPRNPESIRGAKEWLGDQLPSRYDPISHQAKFSNIFSLNEARTIPSFARLVENLIS
jgi:hypothetical protein